MENAIEDELKYEGYKYFLFNNLHMRHEMKRIQSIDDIIGSYKINRIYFSFYNNKKSIYKNGYSRLPHFHTSSRYPYKNNFVEYRQFSLFLALFRTAVLFTIFFIL